LAVILNEAKRSEESRLWQRSPPGHANDYTHLENLGRENARSFAALRMTKEALSRRPRLISRLIPSSVSAATKITY